MSCSNEYEIIIATYNAVDKLKRCIGSIKANTYGYSLTIVDNKSSDGTREFLKTLKNVNVILNPRNLGSAGGTNIALKRSSSPFIAVIDDDAEVEPGWIMHMSRRLKRDPSIGIVGCKVVLPGNRIMAADFRSSPIEVIGCGEIDRGQRDYSRECDIVCRTLWLMRRSLVDDIGYLDERFFPSQYEDIDYCLRARLAGYMVFYEGKVKVKHHHLFRHSEGYSVNGHRFLKKWKKKMSMFPLKTSHPSDKQISYANSLLAKGRYHEAFDKLCRAKDVDKRFGDTLLEGVALYGMGELTMARNAFRKVLSLNPGETIANHYLALIYNKTGKIRAAKREAESVINSIGTALSGGASVVGKFSRRTRSAILLEGFSNRIIIKKIMETHRC